LNAQRGLLIRVNRLVLVLAILLVLGLLPLVGSGYAEGKTRLGEIVTLRQENSKTVNLLSGDRQLRISMGAIHYKDDYTSDEQWKDIDLRWEGNKITKAPYELTLDGNKITIRDKRTGQVSTIELESIDNKAVAIPDWQLSEGEAKIKDIALDTDLEIVAEFGRVRFSRILKSDRAPLTAKFRVVGDFIIRASDSDGQLPVESSLEDGIITETLKPDRDVKYPVRIDPTYQVGASTDDCRRRYGSNAYWSLTQTSQIAGSEATGDYSNGGGMRFTTIAIAQGATIAEAYLTLRCKTASSSTTVNTRISAEDVDDADTFADDGAAFDTRWAARTTARMDWDAIDAWTADTDYNSSTTDGTTTFASIIQEIVDRGGWASGQDIVIFWEDFEDRSTDALALRYAYSYDGSSTYCPQLVITLPPPPPPPPEDIGTRVLRTVTPLVMAVAIVLTVLGAKTNSALITGGAVGLLFFVLIVELLEALL